MSSPRVIGRPSSRKSFAPFRRRRPTLLTCTLLHSDLEQLADDFPEDFFKAKVMPELMKSVEFVGGGPKALNMVLKIAAKLSSDDFELRVQPFVVRLFGNPDRALRVCLLEALPSMIDRLPPKVVNDKIFPQIVSSGHLPALQSEAV